MKTSCGIMIINENNEIFMVHSTGNKFYDIPKGLLENDEAPIDCAIRECEEETALKIEKESLIELGLFSYNKEKNLHLFLTYKKKEQIDFNLLVCNSFFEDFYTKKMKPEADGFEWKDFNQVENYCAKSMAKLLTKIRENNMPPMNAIKAFKK